MAIAKLNKTVVAGERARATDYNLVSAKVDEVIDAVNNKAEKSHTHSISQVTDLGATLNNKAAKNHTHEADDITDLTNAIDNQVYPKSLVSMSAELTEDDAPYKVEVKSVEKTISTNLVAAKRTKTRTANQIITKYYGGILSAALTERIFSSINYKGMVDTVTDLPTLATSSELDAYRVKADKTLRIRFDEILANLKKYAVNVAYRGTSVYSGTITTDDVVNLRDLTNLAAENFVYARLHVGPERGGYNFLVACDESGNLITPKRVYYVDSDSYTPLRTQEFISDTSTTGYNEGVITPTETSEVITKVKPYWFIINGNVSYSDDGTIEGGNTEDTGGSSDSGSGSSDSGSTDSGGSSSSDTSDWGTFKLMFRIEDGMQLTVTQGSKTRTLTQSDRASNYYASIYVDPDVNVNVTSNVTKTWIKDGNITIATNSNSFTITATNMANRQSYGYISVWSN